MVSTTTFVFANRSDMPPDQSLAWPCNPSQTIRSSSDSLGSGSSTRTRFVDTTSVLAPLFSRKYLSTFLASIAASEHVLGGSDVLFGLVVKLLLLPKLEEILLLVTLFDSSSPSPVVVVVVVVKVVSSFDDDDANTPGKLFFFFLLRRIKLSLFAPLVFEDDRREGG